MPWRPIKFPMIKRFAAVITLLLLGACAGTPEPVVAPAPVIDARDAAPPVIVEGEQAIEVIVPVAEKSVEPLAGKLRSIPLGTLGVRTAPQRLNQLSLLKEDDRMADRDVWLGLSADDAQLLHLLRRAPDHKAVKATLKLIALSPVYEPTGFTPENYLDWRTDMLAALDMYGQAARLQSAALLGRYHDEAGSRRLVTYLLADKKFDAACLEVKATNFTGDFWGQASVLCADYIVGKTADVKSAVTGVVNASGLLPNMPPLVDNAQFIADLSAADATEMPRGTLLAKALTALDATIQASDTKLVAGTALRKAGFEIEAKGL